MTILNCLFLLLSAVSYSQSLTRIHTSSNEKNDYDNSNEWEADYCKLCECCDDVEDTETDGRNADSICKHEANPNILAFLNGRLVRDDRKFPEGTVLVYRCEDIGQYKFTGDNTRTCEAGQWTGTKPSCISLQMRARYSAPVIEFDTLERSSEVYYDGTLNVKIGSTLTLLCLWFPRYGDPKWKTNAAHKELNAGWNEHKNGMKLILVDVTDKNNGIYSCITPQHLQHEIKVKVGKGPLEMATKPLIEITAPHHIRPTLGDKATTVKESQSWDTHELYTHNYHVSTFSEQTTPIPYPTHKPSELDAKNSCLYKPLYNYDVQAYFKGELLVKQVEVPNGAAIFFHCSNISFQQLEGPSQVFCSGGNWSANHPKCRQLIPFNRGSPPPITLQFSSLKNPSITEDGTAVFPRGTSLRLICLASDYSRRWGNNWFQVNQHWINLEAPDANCNDNKLKAKKGLIWIEGAESYASYTYFDAIENYAELRYYCNHERVDRTQIDVFYDRHKATDNFINIKISDQCIITFQQEMELRESYGLTVQENSRRLIYTENDVVELTGNNKNIKNAVAPKAMVCSNGGIWKLMNISHGRTRN